MSPRPNGAGRSSGLHYHGTSDEVRLGDRVKMKRFLRADRLGTVCYIPGVSPRHEELEYEDVRQWAIRTHDGAVYPILYDPAGFQPPKSILLVSRGEEVSLKPDERLL